MENRELNLELKEILADNTDNLENVEKVENVEIVKSEDNVEIKEEKNENLEESTEKSRRERPVRERRERTARSIETDGESAKTEENTERPRRERPVRERRERTVRSTETDVEGAEAEEGIERPRRERPVRERRERTARTTETDGESTETEEKPRERRERSSRGRNKEPEIKLFVGSSPHLRSKETVSNVMRDVVIALIPTLIAGTIFFGIRALILTILSVLSAVGAEYLYQKFTNKKITINDYSAVITGMLLAYNVPVTLPYWMIIVGSAFAIIIVKQLYGGIGMNFMNPALAARAALMASFPAAMGSYVAPNGNFFEKFLSTFNLVDANTYATIDATTFATPLSNGPQVNLTYAIFGFRGGCIGEVSAICLLLGAGYLLYKGVIKPRIPFVYIGTTAVVLLFTGTKLADLPVQLFMGGLILGAFFMATDYVSAPVNRKAQIYFAMGCGIITALIRNYGGLPEGVSYSILFMNIFTPLLEKYCVPKVFGEGRAKK